MHVYTATKTARHVNKLCDTIFENTLKTIANKKKTNKKVVKFSFSIKQHSNFLKLMSSFNVHSIH